MNKFAKNLISKKINYLKKKGLQQIQRLANAVKSKNIHFLIFYGHMGSNFGDLGITLGTINLLRTIYKSCKITFVTLPLSDLGIKSKYYLLSQYPDIEFLTYEIDEIKSKIKKEVLSDQNIIELIHRYVNDSGFVNTFIKEKVDFVLYNSGEHLFSYNQDDVFHLIAWVLPYVVSTKFSTKAICLPSTFGPFTTDLSKEIINLFFSSSDVIFTREDNSFNYLQSIIDSKQQNKLRQGVDPAFFVADTYHEIFASIENLENSVIFVPRLEKFGLRAGKMDSEIFIEKQRSDEFSESKLISCYVEIISRLIIQKKIQIVLLAQTYADQEICKVIYDKVKRNDPNTKCLLFIHPLDFGNYLAILSSAKSIITSRFHTIIFSYLIGKNPIGIFAPDLGVKIPGLMQHYGQISRCYSTTTLDLDGIVGQIEDDSEKKNGYQQIRIQTQIDKAKFFSELVHLLKE